MLPKTVLDLSRPQQQVTADKRDVMFSPYIVLTIIGMALVLLLSTGCVSPNDTQENTATQVENVNLLFAYSPSCPHCAYQMPVISEFEKRYPDIKVTWVKYYELNDEQKSIIKGTSGHPVMVFYSGNHIRQVVGETSIEALEEEYIAFKKQLKKTEGSKIITDSHKRCQ